MFHGLKDLFSIDDLLASRMVRSMAIYHPYGTVDSLAEVSGGTGTYFGAADTQIELVEYLRLANNIKTYTEEVASQQVTEIRTSIAEAKQIVFLGFAYYNQNMTILQPEPRFQTVPKIYGTAFELSDASIDTIKKALLGWIDPARLFDARRDFMLNAELTCADLFSEYGRSLPVG
jgi:hypothetical protein